MIYRLGGILSGGILSVTPLHSVTGDSNLPDAHPWLAGSSRHWSRVDSVQLARPTEFRRKESRFDRIADRPTNRRMAPNNRCRRADHVTCG